jgi:prepilin-type N-terminal cleavage/methylation domain-containing protein
MKKNRNTPVAPQRRGGTAPRPARAFTLVEVLVVVAVIVILVTLLIVALAAATTRAGSARTTALLRAMTDAAARFREDHGVLPQVLDNNRDLISFGQSAFPQDYNELQDWWSITSAAEYLIGYGGAAQDGADGLGIRSPGRDGVWNSIRDPNGNNIPGELAERSPVQSGKIYQPYLQLEDEDLLGSVDAGGNIHLPTDGAFDPADPKVVLDYWGRPIRYYLNHPDRNIDLGDVVALRPFRMVPGSEAVSPFADAGGDGYTSQALKSAGFAFFSLGADGELNSEWRYDDPDAQNVTDFANEDNLVEVGQ